MFGGKSRFDSALLWLDMSALIFSGNPGVGKTYQATAMVLCALDKGRRVAVNWEVVPPEGVVVYDLRARCGPSCGHVHTTIDQANEIDVPVVFFYETYEDVMGLIDADVYNDEAQANAGARDWEKLSSRVRLWLSMHRHFRINLLFFTQHYKFVDVYPRRLASGNVLSMHRFLLFTFSVPRPAADAETGELKGLDLWNSLVVMRPWKDLDHPNPLPKMWTLLMRSRSVPDHYRTHSPKSLKK